jgi:hypothetical protein
MSNWREREWRMPRKGDVVKDHEGNLGAVVKTTGSLTKRTVCVINYDETEVWTDEPAELFFPLDSEEAKQFHIERLKRKGLDIGSLCSFEDDVDVPLQIVHIEWSALRDVPLFWLRDLRKYEDNILKTPKENLIKPFSLNIPPVDVIFSTNESGLKYRLNINLIEKSVNGWAGSGSPWEFSTKEKAYKEVDIWKSRLRIRRFASVINANWELNFPCWTIVSNGKQFKLVPVSSYIGSPAYFPSALHAATCLISIPQDWESALSITYDPLY